MELNRKPTLQEERLIEILLRRSSLEISEDWKEGLLVRPMDNGMGDSLYLFPKGKDITGRNFGKRISDFQFTDADGVEVIASLHIDSDGDLFELDIWKTDHGKLVEFPNI
ncbi:hypothetical protein KCV26_05325 [Petrimonas sulfuriphila]|uniref:DUF6984 family protein n=1 Tax=Petrimonas sulfuriphila TaxID=285070 RepID=UPI0032444FF0